MEVPKLQYPGETIKGLDNAEEFTVRVLLLGTLETLLEEAAVSLDLFTADQTEIYKTVFASQFSNDIDGGRFTHRAMFIHARAFVHAVNDIGKFLKVLSLMNGAPLELTSIRQRFNARFPDLIGIRDSIQHFDERIQGKAKKSPINLNGALWLGNLANNVYEMTMENGKTGRLVVSGESLYAVSESIQEALNAFEWLSRPNR